MRERICLRRVVVAIISKKSAAKQQMPLMKNEVNGASDKITTNRNNKYGAAGKETRNIKRNISSYSRSSGGNASA